MMKLNPFKNAIGEGDKNRFMEENEEKVKKYAEYFEKCYGDFKVLENDKKRIIVRDFVIELPKLFFLVIGIIVNTFIFILNVILFIENILVMGLISITLILLSLALVCRIKQLRKEQYNYYYDDFLRKSIQGR